MRRDLRLAVQQADRCVGARRIQTDLVSVYDEAMELRVELEREDDGRWIAEIPSLPGVMVYGDTRDDALRAVEALALRVLADRLESGEIDSEPVSLTFLVAA